jgi:hypothetical protein
MRSYVKPELVDLAGMETFGLCQGNGSGDSSLCRANGNDANNTIGPTGCSNDGNTAAGFCAANGNAAANGMTA